MKDKLITIIDKYNHLTEMMTKKEVISNQKKINFDRKRTPAIK